VPPTIRELAEAHWLGEGDLQHEHHPVTPVSRRAAEEIADGVLYLKSVASVTALDSGDGLVFLDTGGPYDSEVVFEHARRWRPDTPLAAAVFSHHHMDHVFGTARFEAEAAERGWPPPTVYGHRLMASHFDRYEKTRGWNSAINQRQFGLPVDSFTWPGSWRRPDVTYEETLVVHRGELTLELHHGRGETDDATWTFVPERGILHAGDLFVYCFPNAGNPQKVQRYASDWAVALRSMADLGAELLVSGHGLPVFGADRIRSALMDTAALLDSLEEQTLALMNRGLPLDRVIHEVEVPAQLRDKPYLRPVYDHPQFLVRNIWRRYGGWYDGEPDRLLPAPRAEEAACWVELAGGVRPVLDRALALAEEDNLRLACHLVETAVLAEPDSAEVHAARARIYEARASTQESSMARNILRHAALASQSGKRDLAGDF
jgi:glyoxylase-like metal-dependent hydrolase (beta-lactamase superfamily II)